MESRVVATSTVRPKRPVSVGSAAYIFQGPDQTVAIDTIQHYNHCVMQLIADLYYLNITQSVSRCYVYRV